MKTSVLRVLAVIVFAIVFCFPVLSQDTAEAYYNQSLVLKKKGKYDEAIRLLDQAIRLNSNYIEALFERSEAKQNNKCDLDGSMADLETILQIDPSSEIADGAWRGLYAKRGKTKVGRGFCRGQKGSANGKV